MYLILFYDYVENAVERRAPYRETHLALVRKYADGGGLLMAGAFSDPVDGAALVFKGEDRAAAEAFVQKDPYVTNGIVTQWRIREWTVVAGASL